MQKSFVIGVLTGGPSLERGISLNSARSLLDHLASPTVQVVPIYFDQKRHAYRLSESQLYSNTPADFDFQVQRIAKALTPKQLIAELKRCDLVFPAMHGAFGEDGELQTLSVRVPPPANNVLTSTRRRAPSRVMASPPCPVRSSRSTMTTMRRSCATFLPVISPSG
jgi:hypothetical protein